MKLNNLASAHRGFTVVELMIGVGIVALLSALAVPSYLQARHYGMRSAYVHELRKLADSMQMYANDYGQMPPTSISNPADLFDDSNRQLPGGMATYMPKNTTWMNYPSIAPGGLWGWVNSDDMGGMPDYEGYILTVNVQATNDQMAMIDNVFDDGNIGTGAFRFVPDGSGFGSVTYGVN